MNYLKSFMFFNFLLLCISTSLFAKEINLSREQLEVKLNALDKQDSARIDILNKLVKLCWRTCPDEAAQHGDESLELLNKFPNARLEAELLNFLPRVYLSQGDNVKTEKLITQGVVAAKKINDKALLSFNLFNQAIYHSTNDNSVFALDTYKQLAETYIHLEDYRALGSTYNNIGNIYKKFGDLGKALEYFQLALPNVERYSKNYDYANTLMNIGEIYHQMDDLTQAKFNVFEGMSKITEVDAPLSFVEGYMRLADIYTDSHEYNKALEALNKAEKLAIKYKFISRQVGIYFLQITYGLAVDDVNFAQNALNKTREIASEKLPDFAHIGLSYYGAKIAVKKGDFKLAEKLLQPIIDGKKYEERFYASYDAINIILATKEKLGKVEEANKIIKEIFQQYQNNIEDNKKSQAEQFAVLYKNSEKEKKISELTALTAKQKLENLVEKQEKQNLIYIQLFVGLIFIALFIIGYQRHKILKREAVIANKLIEDKKQFFSDVSHELRTPLTVFKLKVKKLEYAIFDDPKIIYKQLYDRIDGFTNLVNDISLLAQNDKNELELQLNEVDLKPYIESSVETLQLLATDNNLKLETSLNINDTDIARLDPQRITQVCNNLFSNSCRYTNSPGIIKFTANVSNQALAISIEDSAPGLTLEEFKQLFDRLYRADISRSKVLGGSGLGLSICKDLIELHTGEIKAQASELGGIKIDILLPLNNL